MYKDERKFAQLFLWVGYGLGQTTKFDGSLEMLKNLSYPTISFHKTKHIFYSQTECDLMKVIHTRRIQTSIFNLGKWTRMWRNQHI